MTRQRGAKPGHLGPAFHSWLAYLEYVEQVLTGTGKMRGKRQYMAMNDKLFKTIDDNDFRKMMNDCIVVDAYNARIVRSSTKYKVNIGTLMDMSLKYPDELRYIRETRPIHLPFEWCTLIIEGFGPDDIMVCLNETDPRDNKAYPELHVEAGERFIDCNVAFYRAGGVQMMDDSINTGQRLSYCPVELHFNKGMVESETTFLNAIAEGVQITERGAQVVEMVRNSVLLWIHSFHLSSMLRRKQIGLLSTPGKGFRRTRLRKKTKHPHFEHFVVELEVDEPDPQQEGGTVWQPRKRLHEVRGFFRHYKTGKVVYVKSHWRGDETLGVVKKDYEVTLHEDP